MRWIFRKELRCSIDHQVEHAELSDHGKLVLAGLGLVVLVLLVASSLKKDLGLPTCLAALVVTAVVCLRSRTNPIRLAREISWATLALVAGLFVMVDAIESIGALEFAQRGLAWAQGLTPAVGALVASFTVGIANNLVNNLPLGLIAGGALKAVGGTGLISNAVLIGVDLGPNLSVTGSLATILWLLALRREGLDVSFWKFLKVGAVAMPIALVLATGAAIAMHSLPSH